MSYQVLARKWRPRAFSEMVGQEHVLKALINALDHNRLHHAYLFTGTRGVGKTTVARILAKCLNCETGVGSTPCGACSACVEINEGRFVDLIEVDAASRTKVEDTRELLDNVQYAPTTGRFKIYLIDEVHMLSNSSFNALLKTLEEPPEHVKFLLATTDPQKLPATILSRCLQFNLKNMSPEKIVEHLKHVLNEEMVPLEETALWQLARAADGSMRDALSLTDQAIAFGNGKLAEADVSAMLGTIDHGFIQNIVDALIVGDGASLLQAVSVFAEQAPDYSSALADLQTMFHRIAIAQALPEALDNSYGDRSRILDFATRMAPEDVQLYYQVALMGQRDLNLSQVPRTAFEMVLLRMLAFKPQGVADVPTQALPASGEAPETVKKPDVSEAPEPRPLSQPATLNPPEHAAQTTAQHVSEPLPNVETAEPSEPELEPARGPETAPEADVTPMAQDDVNAMGSTRELEVSEPATAPPADPAAASQLSRAMASLSAPAEPDTQADAVTPAAAEQAPSSAVPLPVEAKPAADSAATQDAILWADFQPSRWYEVYVQLPISGVVKMTASHLACERVESSTVYFVQDASSAGLLNREHSSHLADALSAYFNKDLKVDIRVADTAALGETPAQTRDRLREARRQSALASLRADPIVLAMQREFDARLDESSLEFIES